MSLTTVLENVSEASKYIDRLEDVYGIFSGYDIPRYVNADTSIAGKLGMWNWGSDYAYRPVCSVIAGGSLTDSKYYSVKLVAVDTNWASVNSTYRMSNPTLPSAAVQVSGSNLSIRITAPAHPQQDYNGLVAEDACKVRYVYVCEGDTAAGAEAGVFSYAGVISNNTDDTTFDLTSFAATTTEPFTTMYPPPNARCCVSAYNILWCAGGVTETNGQAQIKQGTESESTASIAEQDSLSNIWRYTVSTWPSIDIYEGDLITVTGSGNAGNDVIKAKILHYNSTDKWVDVENESGVAEGSGGSVEFIQNHILGNSNTRFTDGLEGGTFRFTGENGIVIRGIEVSDKVLTLETEYAGSISADTDTDYSIVTKYGLYYSSTRNPHWFPATNFISIPTNTVGLSYFDLNIIVFTSDVIYRIDAYSPENGLFVVSEHIGTLASKSIVRTTQGIYFFDGQSISVTDGSSVVSSIPFKISDFIVDIDWENIDLVRSAWIPAQNKAVWFFPTTGHTDIRKGVMINLLNNDVMPITVTDISEVWTGYDSDSGQPLLKHGTSGVHNNSSNAYLWEHDLALEYDGLPASSAKIGYITDVDTNELTVQGTTDDFTLWTFGAVENNEGIPAVIFAADGGWEQTVIIKSMTEVSPATTPKSFTVALHTDYDLSSVQPNDYFLLSAIPCSYGPKWFDFASARYLHAVFDLKVCFSKLTEDAVVFVDWFVNLDPDTLWKRNIVALSEGDTEFTVNCAHGNVTSVGFRIRWYGPGRINIQNYVLTFDTRR